MAPGTPISHEQLFMKIGQQQYVLDMYQRTVKVQNEEIRLLKEKLENIKKGKKPKEK